MYDTIAIYRIASYILKNGGLVKLILEYMPISIVIFNRQASKDC